MKKLTCLLISALLAISCFAVSASADKGGNSSTKIEKHDNGKASSDSVKDNKNGTPSIETNTIKTLKEQLKENHKNKEIRKELIKKIVEVKRQDNDTSVPVFVYGEEVVVDTPPVIKYGRMVIPVRPITNALGADVDWNSETKTVTISKYVYGKGTTTILLTLGSNIAKVDGVDTEIGAKAEIINNRTMVPIRFIAETLKQKVEYDADIKAVIIDEDETPTTSTPVTNANTTTTSSGTTVNISTTTEAAAAVSVTQ